MLDKNFLRLLKALNNFGIILLVVLDLRISIFIVLLVLGRIWERYLDVLVVNLQRSQA